MGVTGSCPPLSACCSLDSLGRQQAPDSMGAKRVVTGRDGHFALLECLSVEALCHFPMATQIRPGLWGNQGTKVLFILSCRYASDFASVQAPACSSDVVFTYPLAPPFKTQSLGILFPVMNPDISLPLLSTQAQGL